MASFIHYKFMVILYPWTYGRYLYFFYISTGESMTSDYEGIIPEIEYFICRYCTPKWSIHKAAVDFIDLTYIFDGRVTYIVNDTPFEAEKGDLIYIPKGSMRQAIINPDKPMAAYASNFQLFNLDGKDISLPFSIKSKIGIHEDLLAYFHELNLEWTHKKPGYGMKVRSLFLTILHKLFGLLYYGDDVECMDIQIRKALRFIHDFYDTKITVKGLAEMAGLNSSYFGTRFKKITGLNVKEYINMIRISNAENLLLSGEFSINEVIYKCGFEDSFYFSRVFKKHKGYPPSKIKLIQR